MKWKNSWKAIFYRLENWMGLNDLLKVSVLYSIFLYIINFISFFWRKLQQSVCMFFYSTCHQGTKLLPCFGEYTMVIDNIEKCRIWITVVVIGFSAFVERRSWKCQQRPWTSTLAIVCISQFTFKHKISLRLFLWQHFGSWSIFFFLWTFGSKIHFISEYK